MMLQAKASRATMAAQRQGGHARLRNRVMLADRWPVQLGLGGGGDGPQPKDTGFARFVMGLTDAW